MTTEPSLESLLRRERAITAAGLAVLTALAWLYLFRLRGEMAGMADMGMAQTQPWTALDAALAAVMWLVMMIAMMLPSAAPMIVIFTTVNRKRREGGQAPSTSTGVFALGYVVVWGTFGAAAAASQWALQRAALLSDDTMRVAPAAGAMILIAAALYQLTPLKYACLARCRTPLGFLLSEWRDGRLGAFVMGVRHGLFCVGCCWALMALLFVGGVMNLAWVAAIAAFVLLEKVAPGGRWLSWLGGAILLTGALWMLRAGP
jgi:predicted metal-binding membrane protein